MNRLKVFGKNVKIRRKKARLAQQDLAVIVGIDRSYLSEIENGHRNPSLLVVFAISDALQCSLSQLLEDNI
ncbi:MAG: helix-turn-helix transcriptional regulator [Alphaproteobacteria bacterium]|nr:helix-turn-helix transcriptional regulator [Alphaproteobacteria bacterium]